MQGHPAIQRFLRDIVVDSGVVNDDEHGLGSVVLFQEIIHKVDDRFAFNRMVVKRIMQFLRTVVQSAYDGAFGMMRRLGEMWQTNRRPCALHRRRGAEGGFVKVDHVAVTGSRALAEFVKKDLLFAEFRFGSFF